MMACVVTTSVLGLNFFSSFFFVLEEIKREHIHDMRDLRFFELFAAIWAHNNNIARGAHDYCFGGGATG
jgi:hypothetical protein